MASWGGGKASVARESESEKRSNAPREAGPSRLPGGGLLQIFFVLADASRFEGAKLGEMPVEVLSFIPFGTA